MPRYKGMVSAEVPRNCVEGQVRWWLPSLVRSGVAVLPNSEEVGIGVIICDMVKDILLGWGRGVRAVSDYKKLVSVRRGSAAVGHFGPVGASCTAWGGADVRTARV